MHKTVADIIPNAFTGDGIFSAFNNPVWVDDFNAEALDIQFITTFGQRLASPYLSHFDGTNGITDEDLQAIADHIYAINAYQWEHLYNAVKAEYNPIHNVDAYETEDISDAKNISNINTSSDDGGYVRNNDTSDDISTTHTTTDINSGSGEADSAGNGNSDNDISAFNSGLVNDTANDSATDALTATTSEASSINNETGADSHDISDSSSSVDSNNGESVNTTNSTGDTNRVVRRYGNIGVTTNAQMITGEIELWKFNFINRVMTDICDIIALSIYN